MTNNNKEQAGGQGAEGLNLQEHEEQVLNTIPSKWKLIALDDVDETKRTTRAMEIKGLGVLVENVIEFHSKMDMERVFKLADTEAPADTSFNIPTYSSALIFIPGAAIKKTNEGLFEISH